MIPGCGIDFGIDHVDYRLQESTIYPAIESTETSDLDGSMSQADDALLYELSVFFFGGCTLFPFPAWFVFRYYVRRRYSGISWVYQFSSPLFCPILV